MFLCLLSSVLFYFAPLCPRFLPLLPYFAFIFKQSRSHQIKHSVKQPPNIILHLDIVSVKPERTIISVDLDITIPVPFGSPVAFNCTTLSYPDPEGYNFYYNDQELGSNNTGIYHHQLRRSGDYSCVPFNSAGKGKKALLRIVVRGKQYSRHFLKRQVQK